MRAVLSVTVHSYVRWCLSVGSICASLSSCICVQIVLKDLFADVVDQI